MCTSHFFDALMTYLGFGFSFSLSHPAFPLFLFRSLIPSFPLPTTRIFRHADNVHFICSLQFLRLNNSSSFSIISAGNLLEFFWSLSSLHSSTDHLIIQCLFKSEICSIFLFISKLDKSTYFDFDNLALLVDQPRQLMDTNNELPLIPTDCDSVVEGLQNFALVFESRYDELVFLNFS